MTVHNVGALQGAYNQTGRYFLSLLPLVAVTLDLGLLLDVSVTPPRSTSLPGHQAGVSALTFGPNGKTLASGDYRGTLRFWDLSVTPPRSILLPGYQGVVRSFTFSPDGKTLASGGLAETLQLWNVSVTPPMSMLPPHDQRSVNVLTFSPDGKTLATSGSVGPLLWNVDFDSWPRHACRIANRNLTCAEWTQFMKDEPYRPTCENLPSDQCEARLPSKGT
jgi:WD40 repeat protein